MGNLTALIPIDRYPRLGSDARWDLSAPFG
jgi:hypothetical protein